MRLIFTLFLTFLVTFAFAKGNDSWVLTLEAQGINTLKIISGAGILKVHGSPGQTKILVTAHFRPEGLDPDKLMDAIELNLKREGQQAVLISRSNAQGLSLFHWFLKGQKNIAIDLTVEVPQKMNLDINDGSGFTQINRITGNINITDGSGDLTIQNVDGALHVLDGSGGLLLQNINGNCQIIDGSGSITVKQITGNMVISDGSGSMVLKKIKGKLELTDGSGDIEAQNISQSIIISDGSGDIRVSDVNGDLIIKSNDSGGVFTKNIRGKIIGLHQ